MTPLVIIGAGGFGRECHDIVVAMNEATPQWEFLGFIDDKEPDPLLLARRGVKWLGTTRVLSDYAGCGYVVGVGSPELRRALVALAEAASVLPVTLIHPTATFGLDVVVGAGSVVCSHVSVTTHVRVGQHVHINLNCTVGHDVDLGSFSTMNPGATLSGAVSVGESVVVGTNAAVIQEVRLGEGSIVGAGAVVLREVPSGVTVVGVPATPLA